MSSSPDLYSAFRTNGGPTVYPEIKTAWQADILGSGLIYAFCILAVSFIVIIPGIKGKESVFTIARVLTSLFIGAVILLTNFGYTWDTADISTHTKYKAGISNGIQADVKVFIGLRGINITLKGKPEHQLNETINYNEHFSWEGAQGRFGYGPYASRINQEYRAAQFRGLPQPILWIAEYFVFDEEGVRWGRFYRTAGFYSEILLWLAFALWLVANILFFVTLRYASYVLGLCGACMVGAILVWSNVRNPFELMIPFTDKDILKFSHGGSFWICMTTGILSIGIAIVVRIVHWKSPLTAAAFFSIDVSWDQEKVDNDHMGKMERSKQDNLHLQDVEDPESGKKPNKVTKSFEGHVHNDWDSDVKYYSDDDLPPTDEENNDGDYSSDVDNYKDPNQCTEMTTPRNTSYGLVIPRSKTETKIIQSTGTVTNMLLITSPSDVSTSSSGIGSESGSISGTSNASTRISIPITEGSSISDHKGKMERSKQDNLHLVDVEDPESGKKPNKVTKSVDGHVHNDWNSDVEYYSDDDLPPTDEENNEGDYSSDEDNYKDPNECTEMTTPRGTSNELVIPRSKTETKIIQSTGTVTDTVLITSPSNVSTSSSVIGTEAGSISGTSTASTGISIPISEGSSISDNRGLVQDDNEILNSSIDDSIPRYYTVFREVKFGRTSSAEKARSRSSGNAWPRRESTNFPNTRRKQENTGVRVFDRHNQVSPV